jgi:3-oxoacyl-[acyl-carrier-protein] synthase III
MNAFIKSVGVYVPKNILTNVDLEKRVDTTDAWISSRTGIRERQIIEDASIKTSDIATAAAREAIERAGIDASEVDGIIAGSMSYERAFPALACLVAKEVGCTNAFAVDITAACAAMPYAINIATLMIRAGQAKNILIVGAEICSRIVDWSDRATCVLFGDAAGALLLSATEENRGVLASTLKADGRQGDILYLGGDSKFLKMDGAAVFKLAVTELAAVTKQTLEKVDYKVSDLDLFVPHQANVRIIESVGARLGIAPEKVMINVDRYGNTSSASIPLALYEALEEGRLKPGMLVALSAFGGGITWGCNVIRW